MEGRYVDKIIIQAVLTLSFLPGCRERERHVLLYLKIQTLSSVGNSAVLIIQKWLYIKGQTDLLFPYIHPHINRLKYRWREKKWNDWRMKRYLCRSPLWLREKSHQTYSNGFFYWKCNLIKCPIVRHYREIWIHFEVMHDFILILF